MEPDQASAKERIYDAFRLLRMDLMASGLIDDFPDFIRIADTLDLPPNFKALSSEDLYEAFKQQLPQKDRDMLQKVEND